MAMPFISRGQGRPHRRIPLLATGSLPARNAFATEKLEAPAGIRRSRTAAEPDARGSCRWAELEGARSQRQTRCA